MHNKHQAVPLNFRAKVVYMNLFSMDQEPLLEFFVHIALTTKLLTNSKHGKMVKISYYSPCWGTNIKQVS